MFLAEVINAAKWQWQDTIDILLVIAIAAVGASLTLVFWQFSRWRKDNREWHRLFEAQKEETRRIGQMLSGINGLVDSLKKRMSNIDSEP